VIFLCGGVRLQFCAVAAAIPNTGRIEIAPLRITTLH
jgi:hypothetical protein